MKRLKRNDEGAMLIFALLIITTIALVTAALLTRGQGNLLATVQLRTVAGAAYGADAATNIAINDLQLGENAGNADGSAPQYPAVASGQKWIYDNYADGSGCFGLKSDGVTPKTSLELKNVALPTGSQNASTSARVECAPVAGTGLLGSGDGVPITGTNSPGRALTVLGDGSVPGDGIRLKPLGAGNDNRFVVAGGMASNANIAVSNGDLFSSSYVWARTGCSGTILSTPAKDCSHAAVSDPNYAADISTVPAYQPIPSGCTFSPGYYDDSNALTAKTSSCATSVFTPGTYYFDFHNNDSGNDPTANADAVPPDNDTWNITRTVIGGVATGASTSPGRCVSPIESASADGVQFIFGGDSRISLGGSAIVELCGTSNVSTPPIVLFGLNTSDVSAGLVSPPVITAGTLATTGSSPAWTAGTVTAGRLASVDGTSATWGPSPNSGSPVGVLTLTGFTPGSAIPSGSMLASAQLQVTHSETVSSGSVNKISVTVDPGAGGTPQTFNPNVRSTLGTDNFDVSAVLAKAVHNGSLATAVPTITIRESGRRHTLNVDAVRLVLTYYPPSLRGQTTTAIPGNCIPTGGCDFVSSGNNSGAVFVVNGVTYTPKGSIAIDPGNGNGLIAFRYGLIARGLDMKGQPKYTFGYPVVSIPDQGPGFGSNITVVDLKVYLCTGQATCASGGTLTLTSRVKITDPVNTTPAPSTRKISILSWSEQR